MTSQRHDCISESMWRFHQRRIINTEELSHLFVKISISHTASGEPGWTELQPEATILRWASFPELLFGETDVITTWLHVEDDRSLVMLGAGEWLPDTISQWRVGRGLIGTCCLWPYHSEHAQSLLIGTHSSWMGKVGVLPGLCPSAWFHFFPQHQTAANIPGPALGLLQAGSCSWKPTQLSAPEASEWVRAIVLCGKLPVKRNAFCFPTQHWEAYFCWEDALCWGLWLCWSLLT